MLILSSGCRTRGASGGLGIVDGELNPDRIVQAIKTELEKNDFSVTMATNSAHSFSFCGSTVTGTVTASRTFANWDISQYRWRPWGKTEYNLARHILEHNMK